MNGVEPPAPPAHPRQRSGPLPPRPLPPGGGAPPGVAPLLLAAGLLLFLYLVRDALVPFVIAGILAYILTPAVDRLALRTGWPRGLFAAAALVLVIAVIGGFAWLAVPPMAAQLGQALTELESSSARAMEELFGSRQVVLLGATLEPADIVRALREGIGSPDRLAVLAGSGLAGLFGIVLVFVLSGYLLFDGRRLARGALWLVPPPRRGLALQIWRRLDPLLRRYFVGMAIVVLYTSCAAYLGLALFLNLDHALLLAVVTGVLELVPVVGPAASAVIAGLVALGQPNGLWNIAAFALYVALLRVSVDQFVGPIVLGRAAHLPPVIVIFCFLAGGLLFGLLGLILAVPAALVVRAVLEVAYGDSPADLGPDPG